MLPWEESAEGVAKARDAVSDLFRTGCLCLGLLAAVLRAVIINSCLIGE